MGRTARIATAYAIGVVLGLVAAQYAGLFATRDAPGTHASGFSAVGSADDLPGDMAGCDAGNGDACLRAAHELGHTRGGDRDVVAVARLLDRACSHDLGLACDELGTAAHNGDGVAQSATHAFELFDHACRLGIAHGCAHLSLMYRAGDGATVSIANAQVANDRACTLGDGSACDALGLELRDGTQRARDVPRGLAVLAQACDHDPLYCYHLGSTYLAGKDVPPDRVRALGLFQRGCDGGDPLACNTLGELWVADPSLQGSGGVRAIHDMFQRACNGGISTGCINLGLERGSGSTGSEME